MKRSWFKLCLIFTLINVSIADDATNSTILSNTKENSHSKILSRKRRYLIFPDGSSFQLVICEQNHGYLRIGDIVWFGNTAALAWELPSDPNTFAYLYRAEKAFYSSNRREDNKHIVYFDEDGKILAKVPYRKNFIVNPAFAKRSIDSTEASNTIKPMSRREMHEASKNTNHLSQLDDNSIKFHREGRKSLYVKVEKVLESLGWNGKECLLRLLCENNKAKNVQGGFLDEILRATFTFPKCLKPGDFHLEYDGALSAEDCEKEYPECIDNGVLFKSEQK